MTLLLLLVSIFLLRNINAHQPDPGFYPSSNFPEISFQEGFTNLWGPQHQQLDGELLTIWLDSNSGSGFKSLKSYRNGYIGADMMLKHSDYTAGVDASIYLSSMDDCSGPHDEVDIEILGHAFGEPYVVQTNVFINGYSGSKNTIGREMKFNLWFDPSQGFHQYGIYWDENQIIFFVDDVPIRRYPETDESDAPMTKGPLFAYGSIWDASAWATDNGNSKANYQYQPFLAQYKNFKISACEANGPCPSVSVFPPGLSELSDDQKRAMEWVQKNYMIYNYCDYANVNRAYSTNECT